MMLPEDEQWDDLWKNGTFLTHHIEPFNKFSLYALYDFFVEVQLDPLTNRIKGKEHFKSGHSMDKYAGCIDIEKI